MCARGAGERRLKKERKKETKHRRISPLAL